jgi:protein-L-isoaspartate(D-aspartate) O-methyltransferase
MSTYKVIEVIGTSATSWEDAAAQAVKTAGETLHDLRVAEVLDAMRHTPRAALVPAAYADRAYHDGPVPIPHHQVTTQPSLCAAMIAALRLDGTQQVLQVGTG